MSSLWDRPPLPAQGDANPKDTYVGVGCVLSQWERVELQIGYVYTGLVGKHGEWEALREFGEGATTRSRLCRLKQAASQLFIAKPHQWREGDFDRFCKEAEAAAARRHDVAHGVVRSHEWANWWVSSEASPPQRGFFLLPSHYKGSAYNEIALPEYAYTSKTLWELQSHLSRLETEAVGFASLMGQHASPKS